MGIGDVVALLDLCSGHIRRAEVRDGGGHDDDVGIGGGRDGVRHALGLNPDVVDAGLAAEQVGQPLGVDARRRQVAPAGEADELLPVPAGLPGGRDIAVPGGRAERQLPDRRVPEDPLAHAQQPAPQRVDALRDLPRVMEALQVHPVQQRSRQPRQVTTPDGGGAAAGVDARARAVVGGQHEGEVRRVGRRAADAGDGARAHFALKIYFQ